MNRVFDKTNANYDIFTVPTLEGTDEDDNGHGAIGDATAKHVSYLSKYRPGDRQLWEDLIVTGNGLIFRVEPSTDMHDPDPYNLKGKDMEKYFEKIRRDHRGRFLPENTFSHLREAMEEESARQVKSEDAYDRCELLSYDQLQNFPGMMSCIDVPQTPKDRLVFMGETSQKFYDFFPSNCQDANHIEKLLSMLDREEEKLTDEYMKYCQFICKEALISSYTKKYLYKMIDDIILGRDPVQAAQEALIQIDGCSRKEYLNKVAERTKKEDPIYMLLRRKEKEWTTKAKQGTSVYTQIKIFGHDLFEATRSKGLPTPKAFHWEKYKQIKAKFAPRVTVNRIDINRASLSILKSIFRNKAEDVWFKRPFETIYHLRRQGYLTKDHMAFDDLTEKILAHIDTLMKQYEKDMNPVPLNNLRTQLLAKQSQGSHADWSQVWSYYNIVKSDILLSLKIKQNRKPTREELTNKWLQEHKNA